MAKPEKSKGRAPSNDDRHRSNTRYWREIKGRLYARFQYFDLDGKRKEKLVPISDKRKARSAVEKLRSELAARGPELFAADKMTFDNLLEEYEKTELIEAVYQDGIKIKGLRSVSPVRAAIKPLRSYFGKKLLNEIRPSDILNYKSLRLATPIEKQINKKIKVPGKRKGVLKNKNIKIVQTKQRKIASVNRELASLRSILNFGVINDWLFHNPFTRLKAVISTASEVQRDRVLSVGEENRLLAACTGERAHLKPILLCALDTAMRRGEILKMAWRDVEFETNQIFIPQTNTKTEESRRLAMTARLRNELLRLWASSPKDIQGSVFGIVDFKHAWTTACELAGVRDFRFHDCRHTATSRMIASGSPYTEVMKITGHSQIKTFLRYLNMTPETTNKVASRLDAYNADIRSTPLDEISSAIN